VIVKLMMQVRLLPTPDQATALEATLLACNEAATWVSKVAFERKEFKNFALRKVTYELAKERWQLGAQASTSLGFHASDPTQRRFPERENSPAASR
jgi:hypothetical protein